MAFSGFFLTDLGAPFLRQYYRTVVAYPFGILLVAEFEGDVVGFAAGFADPSSFYRLLCRRAWLFGPSLWWGCLRRPSLVSAIVKRALVVVTSRSRETKVADVVACELSSIAVSPTAAGRGIGRQLLEAFVNRACKIGAGYVRLTTDAVGNSGGNRFYTSAGFTLRQRIESIDGRVMNEYAKNVSI
jgi:ribosomal protein S18 acetylase RimI-like enzyme